MPSMIGLAWRSMPRKDHSVRRGLHEKRWPRALHMFHCQDQERTPSAPSSFAHGQLAIDFPPSMRCQHIEDGNLHATITRETCSCVCEPCAASVSFLDTCSIVIAESDAYQAQTGMLRQSLDIPCVGMQAVQDNASIDLASGRSIPCSGELIAELWRLTSSCVSLTSAARLSTTVSTL